MCFSRQLCSFSNIFSKPTPFRLLPFPIPSSTTADLIKYTSDLCVGKSSDQFLLFSSLTKQQHLTRLISSFSLSLLFYQSLFLGLLCLFSSLSSVLIFWMVTSLLMALNTPYLPMTPKCVFSLDLALKFWIFVLAVYYFTCLLNMLISDLFIHCLECQAVLAVFLSQKMVTSIF